MATSDAAHNYPGFDGNHSYCHVKGPPCEDKYMFRGVVTDPCCCEACDPPTENVSTRSTEHCPDGPCSDVAYVTEDLDPS